ncbi:MAG: glycosyltransferase family 4 protein [Bacteroidales bacterium]|nr:glycosyltransferase family 4 protein [Bacteroidales bacterium]
MKRVLIITYYWPPSGGAGVQRWLKFTKYLPEFGWEPFVLTIRPEYATYPVLDKSLNKEVSDKVHVVKTASKEWFSLYQKVSNTGKVPYAGFANETSRVSFREKVARFIRGNFFIPDPRKGWNKHALFAARKMIRENGIDVVATTSPPHSTQLIGLKLSREFHLPWLADLRDPWTDIYFYRQFYPTFPAHTLNKGLERRVLHHAAMVTTVSASLQQLLAEKIRTGMEKIRILPNGFDPDDFKNLSPPASGKFVITYVGTLAESYPLEAFLEAFKRFLDSHPGTLLRFIGTLAPVQKKKIGKLPPQNIEMIPYVEHRTAIEYMSSSSALLLIIPRHQNNKGIVTGKLFEYLAVARPVLFLGPEDGDGAEIIRRSGAGKVSHPEDTDKIMEILSEWKNRMPEIIPNIEFSRKNLTGQLATMLDEMQAK